MRFTSNASICWYCVVIWPSIHMYDEFYGCIYACMHSILKGLHSLSLGVYVPVIPLSTHTYPIANITAHADGNQLKHLGHCQVSVVFLCRNMLLIESDNVFKGLEYLQAGNTILTYRRGGQWSLWLQGRKRWCQHMTQERYLLYVCWLVDSRTRMQRH